MTIITVSGCSVIKFSICEARSSARDGAEVAKYKLSGASSVNSERRSWIRLSPSSKQRYRTVPFSVRRFQKRSPLATFRQSRRSNQDLPIFDGPDTTCIPCGIKLLTIYFMGGMSSFISSSPLMVLIFSFFMLYSFRNKFSFG